MGRGISTQKWGVQRSMLTLLGRVSLASKAFSSTLTCSALHTEVKACSLVMQWLKNEGLSHISLHTDSALFVQLLQSTKAKGITVHWTISYIRNLATSFCCCRIMKVNRQQVASAHNLARWCRVNRRPSL